MKRFSPGLSMAEQDALIIWDARERQAAPLFGFLAFFSWVIGVDLPTAMYTEWDSHQLLSARVIAWRGQVKP
jgi:hypothetical protein